jgi:DNA processing protein
MTPSTDAELTAMLALHLAEGVGPARVAALVGHFGTAEAATRASETALAGVDGIGPRIAAAIRRSIGSGEAAEELRLAREAGVAVHARGWTGYPAWLADVPGSPHLLFMRGEVLPTDERAVALVGTRHPTAYGRRIAAQLGEGLARAGVVVVSGMARGVDGISHEAALKAGGRTIAALAGGLSRVYPPEHTGLSLRIAANGALVTESAMGTEPLKGLFPARNRIISGLSRLVVIVQAGEQSGALITATHAAEQGRTVMAVPGPVDEAQCAGCHRLIRDGAALCRSVEDVLQEMEGISPSIPIRREEARSTPVEVEPPRPAGPPTGLDEQQMQIWGLLEGGPVLMDEIAQRTGLDVARLAGVLMMLEIRRVVRRLPGNRYERA